MNCSPPSSSFHGDSSVKNPGVGCHALLQVIFPTQRSYPNLVHFRWILYHLSHQGSPRIAYGVAYPFSRGTSQLRYRTDISFIAGRSFTSWATREAFYIHYYCYCLEKAMAPHSSTLAWKIPGMGEPGRLQSMGSRRVGHDWATSLSLFTFMHWRRKWQPTPVFLPGESRGWRSLVSCCLWGRTELDTTEVT